MSLRFIVFSAIALTISFLQFIEGAKPVSKCASVLCGPHSLCTTCELNACNNYTCANPNGAAITCIGECQPTEPTCVCKPNYHRATPGAPCTRLQCPKTCDTKKCGPHEMCTECGINGCNTYTCSNPSGMLCKPACVKSPPKCICKPNYHRATPGAPCTRLQCPNTPGTPPTMPSCNTVKCTATSRCTTCEPNACNTYSCKNPDGKGKICTTLCKLIPPKCVCIENHHRETPDGPCVPLKC